MSPKFKSYYLNELENYKNNIFQPSILDIQRKYFNEIKLEEIYNKKLGIVLKTIWINI